MRLIVVVLLAGCSFVAVRVPAHAPPNTELHCGRKLIAPLVDTVVTAAMLAVFVTTVADKPCDDHCDGVYRDARPALAFVGLISAMGYGASAAYGFHRNGRCRALSNQRADEPDLQQQR